MRTLEEIRARDAKEKAAWFAGERETHPYGASGEAVLIPHEDGRNMWDTHPRAWRRGEWAHLIGATHRPTEVSVSAEDLNSVLLMVPKEKRDAKWRDLKRRADEVRLYGR